MVTRRESRTPVFAILAIVMFALSACAVNPATGRQSFTGLMTTADEIRMGREQNPQVLEAFGGAYKDPALAAYVNRVGQSLARHSERKDITYTFTILDTPIVNALALPGGYIYVTRGLLALAGNEAELAGVLGHELGHITARHHAEAHGRELLAGLGLTILGAVAGSQAAQGTQLLAAAFLRSYTRQQEYEADLLGIRYMAAAGYDPDAMATFLGKLQEWTNLQAKILGRPASSERLDYLSTHPNTVDRVRQAMAAANVKAPKEWIVGRDSYLDQIDGMLYGESPSQGIIQGRNFIHPVMRIRFEVPAGYQLFDTQRAVFAIGPEPSQIVFDTARIPAGVSVEEYVRQGALQLKLANTRKLNLRGFEAAEASGIVRTNRGSMELTIAAIRANSNAVYRFRFLTASGGGAAKVAAATLGTFRRMSAQEAAAIKPLRLRIVTVKRGESVSSLAARMGFESYRTDRFRVLNGLRPGEGLAAGSRVKIVTY